ncbi:MAG: alpha/beta fold hydrolase [Solirubrobacteraceae bacterium]
MAETGRDRDSYGSPPRSAWLEVDWSAHRRSVDVEGAAVNTVVCGAGEPAVCLIHGHDGSWRNWLETIPQLARHRCVLAPDLPGFGDSPLPRSGRISIPGYAATVAALCERLGDGAGDKTGAGPRAPFVLVGSSLGGLVAAELAIRRADLVERLVLVSPAGLSNRYMGLPRALLAHRHAPLRALSWLSAVSGPRARFMARRVRLRRVGLGAAVRHPEAIAPEIAAILIGAGGRPGSPLAAAAVARHRIADRLGEVRCPTLIVWGAQDAVVAASAAERFAALIPRSRVVILDDSGHLPMLERPARFNALLEAFLAPDGAGELGTRR